MEVCRQHVSSPRLCRSLVNKIICFSFDSWALFSSWRDPHPGTALVQSIFRELTDLLKPQIRETKAKLDATKKKEKTADFPGNISDSHERLRDLEKRLWQHPTPHGKCVCGKVLVQCGKAEQLLSELNAFSGGQATRGCFEEKSAIAKMEGALRRLNLIVGAGLI